MASRIIAYIVLTATQVFGRAFAQAYREAAAKAGKGGAKAAQGAANASRAQQASKAAAAAALSRRSGMSLDEALKVLNISKETPKDEMKAAYERMFEANNKEKGGSFYLQSKVYRARQTLEELMPEQFADGEAKAASGKAAESAEAKAGEAKDTSSSSTSSSSSNTESSGKK